MAVAVQKGREEGASLQVHLPAGTGPAAEKISFPHRGNDAVVNQDRLGHGAFLHGEDRTAEIQRRLGHDGFLLFVGNTGNFICKEICHYSEFSTNQQI